MRAANQLGDAIDRAEAMASRNSGTLTAIILLLQVLLVPGAGWMLVKLSTLQTGIYQAQRDSAVFSDRQIRQGNDINDIKATLKGVETQDDAAAAYRRIGRTNADQDRRLQAIAKRQRALTARLQRLEIIAGGSP